MDWDLFYGESNANNNYHVLFCVGKRSSRESVVYSMDYLIIIPYAVFWSLWRFVIPTLHKFNYMISQCHTEELISKDSTLMKYSCCWHLRYSG